jgi:hypothetical protein
MPIPPGYAEVSCRIKHSAISRDAYVTWGVDVTTTDPTALATAMHTAAAYTGSLLSLIDTTATMGPITVRIGQDGAEPIVGVSTINAAGLNGGTMLPPNVAALVHKRTGRGGRRGRGRMFIPWCLQVGDVGEGGALTSPALTKIQTAAEVLRAQLSAGGNPMVILHEPGLTAAGVPDLVTLMQADPLVSTQRRRLGR